MIKYKCSNGTRVSEATIKRKLSESYRKRYSGGPYPSCGGCGARASESAHIIAKARCKVLHKTELIWDPINYFPSCRTCNQAIENPKGESWKTLWNIEYCLSVIKKYDPETYSKFQEG